MADVPQDVPTGRAVALAHDVVGSGGSVVVLLPALGAHRSMWRFVAAELASAGRVVVPMDLRGLGDSPVPAGPYRVADLGADVLHTLDELDVRTVDVVGVSLGGAVAQHLALEHSERVTGLGLVSTLPRFATREAWTERAAEVRALGTAPLATGLEGKWITEKLVASRPEVLAELAAMVRSTDPEGYAGNAEALAEWDVRGRPGDVVAPTLVVGGAGDRSATPQALSELARQIPGASHVTVADAAHLVPVEQPTTVARLLVEHLGSRLGS